MKGRDRNARDRDTKEIEREIRRVKGRGRYGVDRSGNGLRVGEWRKCGDRETKREKEREKKQLKVRIAIVIMKHTFT